MKLKPLTIFEFDKFAEEHPLGSYHQSSNYALLASEQGYDYDLLGLVDDNNEIQAAALILTKKIGLFYRYGYSPKGFLVDYYNVPLLEEFLKCLKKHYYKKNFAFIKINPEISIGTMDDKNKTINYNKNQNIDNTLRELGFKKMEGQRRFETKLPIFNAIQPLKHTSISTLSKNTRNKVNKAINYGMKLVKGNRENLETLFKFIKNKKDCTLNHYLNYYNAFSRNNSLDIFLVEIDFEECLINLRERYEKEAAKNDRLVEKVIDNSNKNLLKRKLESDAVLTTIKDNMSLATNYLAQNKKKYIAGAITIKYKNRVSILISGYDNEFKKLCPNYFLHYELIKYYQDDYDYIDLNGITGDYSDENPYKGLDEFKKGFNPLTFEYIGEYDYIINEGLYINLNQKGLLAKEFKRKEKSVNN